MTYLLLLSMYILLHVITICLILHPVKAKEIVEESATVSQEVVTEQPTQALVRDNNPTTVTVSAPVAVSENLVIPEEAIVKSVSDNDYKAGSYYFDVTKKHSSGTIFIYTNGGKITLIFSGVELEKGSIYMSDDSYYYTLDPKFKVTLKKAKGTN